MDDTILRYLFPVIGAIFSFYYAFKILVLKDTSVLSSKSFRITIDEEGYARKSGYIFVVFGLLLVIYAYLMGWNPMYALFVLIAGIIGIFIAFNGLNKAHGAEPVEKKKK